MAGRKKALAELLLNKAFVELPAFFDDHPAAVRKLYALTYDRNPLLRWRAVSGFGMLARHRPDKVDRTLSRLAYAFNDEASTFAQMAAAVVGEITAAAPELTDRVVRMGVHYLEDEETCHGPNRSVAITLSSLWGAGRAASKRPEVVAGVIETLVRFCRDPEPDLRGHALWVMARAGLPLAGGLLETLRADGAGVRFYDPVSTELIASRVGDFAKDVAAISDSNSVG